MSSGRGIPAWAPGRVTAVAPAAAAARTASDAGTPAAKATASAPTKVSPAPTVSTALTRNAGNDVTSSGHSVLASESDAVRAHGDHGVARARGHEPGGGPARAGQAVHRLAEDGARF